MHMSSAQTCNDIWVVESRERGEEADGGSEGVREGGREVGREGGREEGGRERTQSQGAKRRRRFCASCFYIFCAVTYVIKLYNSK